MRMALTTKFNQSLIDLFLLFHLQSIFIGEGLGLGKILNNDTGINNFQNPRLERHIMR